MQNPNEKMTYEQQEDQIAEKSQAFINLLTQRGILANPKVTDEKIRAARQKKDRDSYHNTLLLLQNYRTLVWVMECFPETVAEELDKPFSDVDELLEQMDLQLAGEPETGKSARRGQKVPAAAGQGKRGAYCPQAKAQNGMELYRLIYLTYIGPETLRHKELLYRLHLSSRQYYRFREQAITILSIRLWSAPAADVDFWLEMLTFLESIQ